MKNKISILILFFYTIFAFAACSFISRPTVDAAPAWEEVEAKYVELESLNNLAGIEAYSKEIANFGWAVWQQNKIKFYLAKSLFLQGKYAESLNIFDDLRDAQPFVNRVHLMAGEASLQIKEYQNALKWTLSVYLNLEKNEKVDASRIVFLSYLYSKRLDTAAQWYSKLDEVKQANIKPDLDRWLALSESRRRDFENALNEFSEGEGSPPSAAAPPPEVEKLADEVEQIETVLKEGSLNELDFDKNYIPNWNNLCVALSSDDKWSKFNEAISSFISWYFADYRKSDVKITFLEYLNESEIDSVMKKAKENGCFAVAGPFFAPEFSEKFIEKSTRYSIPTISYIPFISASSSLFFNVMPTKDLESENILKYAIEERGKKRFAIAYVDDFNGRNLRDLYWRNIEALGGEVAEIIELSPADSAFYDDVEKVVGRPEDYNEALSVFKWKNKTKYTTDTMMKRAIDRFVKSIPGKCDFDALVVLTPLAQMAMLLPSFPYMNVEFEYCQKYLNRDVSVKKQKLKQDGYNWDIQQILALAPSEIVNSQKTIEQLGKLIDGTVVFAPLADYSENNQEYSKLAKIFKDEKGRDLYFIENFIAETSEIIFTALSISKKTNIGDFVETIKNSEFRSLLSGSPVKFDFLNRMVGRSAIMIGRVREPFMTPAQIEEELKQRKEKRMKEKEEKRRQEGSAKQKEEGD